MILIKKLLIKDLKELLEREPHRVGTFGTKYWSFSEDEIKGIIEVLENQ